MEPVMAAGPRRHGDLRTLAAEIATCRLCRDDPARGFDYRLPHEPRPVVVLSGKARILIAGQAPGLKVHMSGVPFNDASGDRLRQWLGVDRETFYDASRFAMLPMGFCFPGYDAKGGDLPPRRECAPFWRQRAMEAMPQIELILTIGQYAQAWHLGEARLPSLTETVAEWRRFLLSNRSPAVLPLPHPSWRNSGWLKKNPWFEQELLPELQKRVGILIS
jgi:uracil-DNA glycosylase